MNNRFKFLVFFLLLFSCNSKPELVTEPNETVLSKNAFWIGTKENGNWFEILYIHPHMNTTRISVYNYKKELIVSKKFILVCFQDKQEFIKDLEKEIVKYSEGKIYLKSGCWLQ